MDQLLEQFLSEARENLAFIDQNIGDIGGADPELLNSVFRAAHTLKGGSGIVGFEAVKKITHHAEDLLDMLRGGKLEFANSMVDVLYDAFDEVVNLIEAAEETGAIVESDEETVERIIASLHEQMGREAEGEVSWSCPFTFADKNKIINLPLFTLRDVSSIKIPFREGEIDDAFCLNTHLYAVTFDIDDTCMLYGNDPIYTLSLLEDKVVGLYSCMSSENTKSVLSGTEDAEGLLLKTSLVAFIYATYEEIEDSLFNFIDDLEFLPLDVETLLSTSKGDSGLQIDSLKELASIADNFDINTIKADLLSAMELVGIDTIQHAKLTRVLDILGIIQEEDTNKLSDFFASLYKGDAYAASDSAVAEVKEKISFETTEVEMHEHVIETLQNIFEQQKIALDHIEEDDDLLRIVVTLEKTRKYLSDMPELTDKQSVQSFLDVQLGLKEVVEHELLTKAEEVQEMKKVEEEKIVAVPNTVVEAKKVEVDVVEEKQKAVAKLGAKPEITRFKGLGEISPEEFGIS